MRTRQGRGTRGAVEGARAELGKERTYQEDLKRIERGNRASSRTTKRATSAERRAESDDVVRGNLPPELVGLFDRVKRSIKAGPRESGLVIAGGNYRVSERAESSTRSRSHSGL